MSTTTTGIREQLVWRVPVDMLPQIKEIVEECGLTPANAVEKMMRYALGHARVQAVPVMCLTFDGEMAPGVPDRQGKAPAGRTIAPKTKGGDGE